MKPNDEVILTAGEIIGLLSNVTADELEAAAASPGLHPEYQRRILEVAKCRRALDSLVPLIVPREPEKA